MTEGASIHNRALDGLDPLVGDWRIEVSNAQFLEEGVTLTGRLSATWLDGRAFLVLRSEIDGDGPPTSVSVIGRNEDRDDYTVLFTDVRGVSRVLDMTFADGEWTQSRADPGFHQRYSGRVSADGSRIDGTWYRSHDAGETWIYDFDVTYLRA